MAGGSETIPAPCGSSSEMSVTVPGTAEEAALGKGVVWDGRGSGSLDAGSKVGREGLVVLEIPGIDGLGFAFGGAG